MSFLTELLAFVVVGDARYGRDWTPLDDLNRKVERGLEIAERVNVKGMKKPEGE